MIKKLFYEQIKKLNDIANKTVLIELFTSVSDLQKCAKDKHKLKCFTTLLFLNFF